MLTLLDNRSLGAPRPLPQRPNLRRDRRRTVDARAWLRADNAASRACVSDLSASGARLICDSFVAPGVTLRLRCYLDGARRPLSTWARAVRSEALPNGGYEIGLRFEGLPASIAQRIERYFARQTRAPRRQRLNPYGL